MGLKRIDTPAMSLMHQVVVPRVSLVNVDFARKQQQWQTGMNAAQNGDCGGAEHVMLCCFVAFLLENIEERVIIIFINHNTYHHYHDNIIIIDVVAAIAISGDGGMGVVDNLTVIFSAVFANRCIIVSMGISFAVGIDVVVIVVFMVLFLYYIS